MTTIGITGASGYVGGGAARLLTRDGGGAGELRLFARHPGRAPRIPGAHIVAMDYSDPREELVAALAGVEVLFFVSAHEEESRLAQQLGLVAAAEEAGVAHLVYTSFVGASPESTFTLAQEHGATEQAIRDAGLAFTFLRDNFYLDLLPFYAGQDGVIRGPAAEGRVAGVARADVAECAAVILRNAGAHRGEVYELTGREALTFGEIAERVSARLGREIRYHAETLEEAYESRKQYHAPEWQVEAWVSTYTAIAAGEMAGISGDVRALTGHEPLVIEDVLIGASE